MICLGRFAPLNTITWVTRCTVVHEKIFGRLATLAAEQAGTEIHGVLPGGTLNVPSVPPSSLDHDSLLLAARPRPQDGDRLDLPPV